MYGQEKMAVSNQASLGNPVRDKGNSEVASHLQMLIGTMEELHNRISRLEEGLVGVLANEPPPPTPEKGSNQVGAPTSCELSGNIASKVDFTLMLLRRVNGIIERLRI